jgi:hypothetical protein
LGRAGLDLACHRRRPGQLHPWPGLAEHADHRLAAYLDAGVSGRQSSPGNQSPSRAVCQVSANVSTITRDLTKLTSTDTTARNVGMLRCVPLVASLVQLAPVLAPCRPGRRRPGCAVTRMSAPRPGWSAAAQLVTLPRFVSRPRSVGVVSDPVAFVSGAVTLVSGAVAVTLVGGAVAGVGDPVAHIGGPLAGVSDMVPVISGPVAFISD